MDNKFYYIDKVKFQIKEDLTLDESEYLEKFFSKSFSENQKNLIMLGNFTATDVKKFFETVLEPTDNNTPLPDGFNFGNIKESVQMDVFKDFFLKRVGRAIDLQRSFAASIEQQ